MPIGYFWLLRVCIEDSAEMWGLSWHVAQMGQDSDDDGVNKNYSSVADDGEAAVAASSDSSQTLSNSDDEVFNSAVSVAIGGRSADRARHEDVEPAGDPSDSKASSSTQERPAIGGSDEEAVSRDPSAEEKEAASNVLKPVADMIAKDNDVMQNLSVEFSKAGRPKTHSKPPESLGLPGMPQSAAQCFCRR
eukprot:gene9902-11728_t